MLDDIKNIITEFFQDKADLSFASNLVVVSIDKDKSIINVVVNFFIGDYANQLKEKIESSTSFPYKIIITQRALAHKITNMVQGKSNIKNIVAISSAKGGVGKSTLTLNTALAMAQLGAKVGILDADIHGPSQPTMQGIKKEDVSQRDSGIDPVKKNGIESASISYFMTKDDPVVWRGPMVSRALEQLVHDIKWGDLDYLFIDMPPGTGDIALTLVKKLPLTASLIVTTPQDIACIDAKKSIDMYAKTNIPLLGVVENMSGYTCEHCGHLNNIFGHGGGDRLSQLSKINFLAKVPLLSKIRICADEGVPVVLDNPDIADIYKNISFKIGWQLALRELDNMRN